MQEILEIEQIEKIFFPTRFGNFILYVFKNNIDGSDHIAISTIKLKKLALVRLHSECLTGDIFKSLRCDCAPQLEKALELLHESKSGVLIYFRTHEGRGIGLANKIRAYALQDQGFDTVTANQHLGFAVDLRDYSIGSAILKTLGVKNVRLLTNNLDKLKALENSGINVIERIPLQLPSNEYNKKYLRTKKKKLGHLIDI